MITDDRTMAPPARTREQQMTALEKANRIRTYRAQLKVDVKRRRANVAVILQEPEERLATMKVYDLLLAIPKVGRTKVNKILVQQRISPSKTVGGLSERQRRELVVAISPWCR